MFLLSKDFVVRMFFLLCSQLLCGRPGNDRISKKHTETESHVYQESNITHTPNNATAMGDR